MANAIPQWCGAGTSVQMTIRVDDDLTVFIDQAARAGEGSRADIINRAIRRKVRRRAAQQDAQVYAPSADPGLETDAYAEWAVRSAGQAWSELGRCTRSGWLDSTRRARCWCALSVRCWRSGGMT